jgi:diguanylate cyclase (GGDEF)-like protein
MAKVPERRRSLPLADRHADVVVELTQMTVRHLLPIILLTGAGLAGATALLSRRYHDRWMWYFTILLIVLTVGRAVLVLYSGPAHRGSSALTLRKAVQWQLHFALGTLVFCLAVAACTWYSFRSHDATAWTLCTIGTFMICAGLAARVSLYPRLIQASGLMMLLVLAIAVLGAHDPIIRVGLLLICLFAYAFVQSVQNRFDYVVDHIRIRRTLSLLADHDQLTGLVNRRHFEAALATTCRMETPFAILFIDIEQLRHVNEAHGRAVGDTLLQRVGVRLKNSVRRGDLVARIGGDEFAILQVEGASHLSAESLARRINRAVATPFEIEGQQILINTCIHIRVSTPEDKDPHALLDMSHQAIYQAQNPGPSSLTSRAS